MRTYRGIAYARNNPTPTATKNQPAALGLLRQHFRLFTTNPTSIFIKKALKPLLCQYIRCGKFGYTQKKTTTNFVVVFLKA